MTPQILILVPMRGGSQRLPGKHLKSLAGASLVERLGKTIETLKTDGVYTVVSTDDAAIADAAKRAGLHVPFVRPAALATAEASSFSVAEHAVGWWKSQFGTHPENVVLLQATTPFRDPAMIDEAIAILRNDKEIDGIVGAKALHRTAQAVFTKTADDRLHRFAQARGEAELYTVNGALYAVRTDAMLRERTFLPARLRGFLMNEAQSIDIDTRFDWLVAEAVAQNRDFLDR